MIVFGTFVLALFSLWGMAVIWIVGFFSQDHIPFESFLGHALVFLVTLFIFFLFPLGIKEILRFVINDIIRAPEP